jgi:hypothetical protein
MSAAKESEAADEAADPTIARAVALHTGVHIGVHSAIHTGSEAPDAPFTPGLAVAGGAARAPRQKWFSIIHTSGLVSLSAVNRPGSANQGTGGEAEAAEGGGRGESGGGDSGAPPYAPLRLALHARSCRSVLRSEVRELRFGNCVVGEPAHKDFTLWNCSEVTPLLISPLAPSNTIACSEVGRPRHSPSVVTAQAVSLLCPPGLSLHPVPEWICGSHYRSDRR